MTTAPSHETTTRNLVIYTPQTRNVRDPLLIVACIRDLPCPLDNFKAECIVRTRQDVFDDKD